MCVINIDWLLVSTHHWPSLFGVVAGFSYVPGCSWGWWSPKWPAKPRTSLRRTQEIVKELVVANIGEKPSQNFLVYPRTCLIYPYLIFCWVRDNMFNCRFFHQQAIDFWWTFTTWGRGIEIQWIFGFQGINGLIAISIRSRKQSILEACMGLFWCLISFTSSIVIYYIYI